LYIVFVKKMKSLSLHVQSLLTSLLLLETILDNQNSTQQHMLFNNIVVKY